MFAISHARLKLALMLATGLSLSLASTSSHAYTYEEQQACSGDAFRLCSSEIPDVDRVTACMVRNKSQLSAGCRVFFHDGPERDEIVADAPGKPLSIKPAAAHKSRAHRIKKPRPDAT